MTAPFLAIAVMVLLALGRPGPASACAEPRSGRVSETPAAEGATPVADVAADAATGAARPAPDGRVAQTPVAVNRASLDELRRLPGIGPRKAAALVDARSRRPFKRPSDLRRVKGFGARTVQRLAPLLSFD